MIRATTGGVMKGYRSNLMNSFINMNNGRNTVLTQRTFNSYAEDPAVAARAFRLRKSRMMVESQYNICADTMRKYDSAVACLQSIDDVLCTKDGVYGEYMNTLTGTTLKMLNDPSGDARTQLSKALDQMSQSIIQTMNQKYGDNFIFAGADGHNVPFEIKGDKLYYRGVPVDAAIPNVIMGTDGETPLAIDKDNQVVDSANGSYYIKMDTSALIKVSDFDDILNDPTAAQPRILYSEGGGLPIGNPQRFNAAGEPDPNGEYYLNLDKAETMTKEEYEQQKLDAEKLDYLVNEKYFVDIGYGFQEDPVTGKLIESSAFNASLNGINFLGYGLDEDGNPKNLYSLVQEMRKIAESVPSGTDWSSETYDEFYRLVQKFEDGVSNYQTEFVNLDASTAKLKNQEELLSDNFYNLQEQYSDLEDVDMVDAITSFIWAEYCYNAALKVGNSILSESLMDYLN